MNDVREKETVVEISDAKGSYKVVDSVNELGLYIKAIVIQYI